MFQQVLNSALKRNAQLSGPNAMINARMLLMSVKRNAVERSHAGLFVFLEREARQQLTLPSAHKPTTACQKSNLRKFQLPSFKKILSNALKKNAPTSGLTARKILNASLLLMSARRNAAQRSHAGHSAFQEREVKLPSMSQSALKPTTACPISNSRKCLLLSQISEILSSALKRSAPPSGLPARRTLSVFQLSKIARRNAEPRPLAGLSAFQAREVRPQLMLPSVLNQTDALE